MIFPEDLWYADSKEAMTVNETLKSIMNRKSVRKFADTPISKTDIQTILKAGMSGPSCVNSRCWSFVVIQDKEMLLKIRMQHAEKLLKETSLTLEEIAPRIGLRTGAQFGAAFRSVYGMTPGQFRRQQINRPSVG